ncbi:DUF6274 family protein [Streptomyces sp. NPDC057445]|uniref:DUF6274 family protein n=1 Tax=Streptomyces sp. NPDC057445 TaxID=3346136 RepID=UPI0036A556B2
MAASTARHETRALLRAHLAAVSGYRHLTRQCPVCHRLLRLAMEPTEPALLEPARPREPLGAVERGEPAQPAEPVQPAALPGSMRGREPGGPGEPADRAEPEDPVPGGGHDGPPAV